MTKRTNKQRDKIQKNEKVDQQKKNRPLKKQMDIMINKLSSPKLKAINFSV